MKKIFFKILIIFFFLGTSLWPLKSSAFSISPTKMFVTIAPSSTSTVSLQIRNTEKDRYFILSVLGRRQDKDGRPSFSSGIEEAEEWVAVSEEKIFIKSGEEKSAEFLITVPKGVMPGAHYVGLAVKPETSKIAEVGLSATLATSLTIQVSGEAREDLKILEWKNSRYYNSNKQWKFYLRLKDDGNIDVPIAGQVAIKNFFGKILKIEKIKLGNNILSGSERILEPEIWLTDEVFWPGGYRAEVQVAYGFTKQTLAASDNFWYLPAWSYIAAAGVVLFFIGLAIFVVRKIKIKK